MRVRAKRLAVVMSVAVAATVGFLPSASASYEATGGRFTLYRDAGLQGDNLSFDTYSPGIGTMPSGWNDAVSSISNYSGRSWCTWTDKYFTGITGVFQNNFTWPTLSYPYQDSASSVEKC
ncbi:peptidase inhibitor family I36 protein [Streptomyces sp. NPDC059459]|uniref:peptidase inhibitor family I36 protein n=1 Tax=unclassified Streptomyces TaxID=2593676 RepID=UPI00369C487D